MEKHVTVEEARSNFSQLVEDVLRGDQVVITERGVGTVVMIDLERLETLRQIAELWQIPDVIAAVREAEHDLANGRVLRRAQPPRIGELLEEAKRSGLLDD